MTQNKEKINLRDFGKLKKHFRMKIKLFFQSLTKKVRIKVIQGHSRLKVQKKVRIKQNKPKWSSQRSPASVSNI